MKQLLNCIQTQSAILIFLLSSTAFAFDEVEIRSPYDKFRIQFEGGEYFINSNRVDIGPLKGFIKAFDKAVGDPCPKPLPKFPLQILLVSKEKSELAPDRKTMRRFSFDPKLLTDGEGCAGVHGRGIFYLPQHRTWYDKATSRLPLAKDFRLTLDGELIAHFEQVNDIWQDARQDQYVNWDFFDRLLRTLQEFPIHHRLSTEAMKGRRQFTITSGKRTFEFARVDSKLWAVKQPDTKWLVASFDWTFLEDMREAQWKDRFAPVLKEILDSDLEIEARVGKLKSLSENWTPTIRQTLHRIVLNNTKPLELRLTAVDFLRKKPSSNNIAILIEALQRNSEPELQSQITRALRVVHPKGPMIDAEGSEWDRQKHVEAWQKWWKTSGKK